MPDIANEKQVKFLQKKLEYIIGEEFKLVDRKFTGSSFTALVKSYYENFAKDYKYRGIKEDLDDSRLADLFNKKSAQSTNDYIQYLALFALHSDHKLTETICLEFQPIEKTKNTENTKNKKKYPASKPKAFMPWDHFLAEYEEEIEGKISYMFYFWNKNHISVFDLKFELDESKNENSWKNCALNFYDYDEITQRYTKDPLPNITKLSLETMDLKSAIMNVEYKKGKKMQLIFSINQDIKKNLHFGVYSGINLAVKIAAGIGLLVRERFPEKRIATINKDGFPPVIYNFLFERRQDIPSDLLENDSIDKLPNNAEIDKISDIAGYWKCIYLRNKPDNSETEKEQRGGIEFNLLHIDPNGQLRLTYEYKEKEKAKSFEYTGFLCFPSNDSKLMKCNLGPVEGKKVHALNMLLNINEKYDVMKGVYFRWTNNGKPFCSLVRLEKCREPKKENDCKLVKQKIRFVPKDDPLMGGYISSDLIRFLKNEDDFLNLADQSLLPSLLYGNQLSSPFAGYYYLLSTDYKQGILDKAKLEIQGNGNFTIVYGDVVYRGTAKKFKLGNANDDYLNLEITGKRKHVEPKFSESIGNFLFHMSNIIVKNEDRLADKVKMLTGVSLRINIEGSLQVKKEFLLPADKKEIFQKEKTDIYLYDDKALFNNVKTTKTDAEKFEVMKAKISFALAGKEDNFIAILKETTTQPISGFRKNDYSQIYFKAFLSDIVTGHENATVYKYFIEAVLHGLDMEKARQKMNDWFDELNIQPATRDKIAELVKKARAEVMEHMKDASIEDLFELIDNPTDKKATIMAIIDQLGIQFRNGRKAK